MKSEITQEEPNPMQALADVIDMPVDQLIEAAKAIRSQRTMEDAKERLMAKVALIKAGNTAILPSGEIVPSGTEGAMEYQTSQVMSEQLTEQQKRVKIAEACGWRDIVPHDRRVDFLGFRPNFQGVLDNLRDFIPDYFHDLNAMNKAEKVLSDDQLGQYLEELWDMVHGPRSCAACATAAQRAEAFGLTLGLW